MLPDKAKLKLTLAVLPLASDAKAVFNEDDNCVKLCDKKLPKLLVRVV